MKIVNKKDKSCSLHIMNNFYHEEDKVEFKLFEYLYEEI